MSILIPEAGIDIEQRFFNPTTSQALLTASFEAQTIVGYNITASVINNKGNESNSEISWFVTGSDADDYSQVTASFQIVKDANVQMVGVDDITQSTGSSFENQYAFNITASLSGSFSSSFTNAQSSSISTTQWLFKSDTLGFNITSISSSVDFTQSFEAQTNVESYDITASAVSRIESSSLVQTYTIGAATQSDRIGEVVEKEIIVINGLTIEGLTKGGATISGSLSLFTSSIDNPGNFNYITTSASSSNGVSQSFKNIVNVEDNYFPWPFVPVYEIGTNQVNSGSLQVVYWGKPSMTIDGSVSTTYYSGSNLTIHTMEESSSLEYSSSIVPTTASALLAETLTVGGGGRGGVKDLYNQTPFVVYDYLFSGGGGAGGYVLANNYFEYGKTYEVVVGDGSPRWDGTAAGALTPISASDSYIYDNTGNTIQLAKGGGNGGPITGSAWQAPDLDTIGAGGRSGGSGGGAGYIFGQNNTQIGPPSISGSVSNPFEVYGAFEGYGGGTTFKALDGGGAVAGGGGGAASDGIDNKTYVTSIRGAGGWGKYDLSFTMEGVAGGGTGANHGGNATASFDFGGGRAQLYLTSGSLDACDGVDGTGGGGGGLISGSGQPGMAPFNYTTKGGSGKVQIRYVSDTPLAVGGLIETGNVSGSNYVLHTFISSSTFELL